MRIDRVTDLDEIMQCLPFEREIRKKGRDRMREADMILFVQSQLGNPFFAFLIAYDEDNNFIGYAIGILNLIPGCKRLYIARMYAKDKDVRIGLEKTLVDWAKLHKVNLAQITVCKNIKAYKRLYGYVPVSVNMERRY